MRLHLSPLLGMLLALVPSVALPVHAQTAPADSPHHARFLADAIRQVLGSVRTGQPMGAE